ncbi:head GIN domain-containing protein [Rhizorhabdus argentea]|uniref:head GIN domain-containing protein n=1 Tax=Rhizorhabdus argentea TaxID=1387174 RepID=UPI0030ED5D1C
MRLSIAGLAALSLVTAAWPAAAATRPFPVPDFSKLRVEGPYTVRVHTGARPSVVARGPQARIDKLIVESRGNMLVISTEKSWNWRNMGWGKNETIHIDIGVPMLDAATLAGSGEMNVDMIRGTDFMAALTGSGDLSIARIETSRLKAVVTGSGDLSISGRTGRAEASVQGSGDLRAGGLTVGLLNASVAGSGDIAVGPTRVARANVAGSGDIMIAGRPSCTKNKVGSGDIICGDGVR